MDSSDLHKYIGPLFPGGYGSCATLAMAAVHRDKFLVPQIQRTPYVGYLHERRAGAGWTSA